MKIQHYQISLIKRICGRNQVAIFLGVRKQQAKDESFQYRVTFLSYWGRQG
jgi:hypothetical protein